MLRGCSTCVMRRGGVAVSRLCLARRTTVTDAFVNRHIGPNAEETAQMLQLTGHDSTARLMLSLLPPAVLRSLKTPFEPLSEKELLSYMRSVGTRNKVLKTMIGQGYYECILPQAIRRNVLENPMWYTPYTPYQAEIAQGHLEALLNFQTMICSITAMDLANASLLDEANAAAEAMHMAYNYHHHHSRKTFFVANTAFRSTIGVVQTYAKPLGIRVVIGDPATDLDLDDPQLAGVLVQTPDATGALHDFSSLFASAHARGLLCCCATDLLACCLVMPPGAMGADVVVGSVQRFGLPMGYGGPHAGFMAFRESLKRLAPGRIIGVSKDRHGTPALRTALQTREQHIKRQRATSNICTAQALTACVGGFFAIYHGPDGLRQIAQEVHAKARLLAVALGSVGFDRVNATYFDTLTFRLSETAARQYQAACVAHGINIAAHHSLLPHSHDDDHKTTSPSRAATGEATWYVSIAIDEATTEDHLVRLLEAAAMREPVMHTFAELAQKLEVIPDKLLRDPGRTPLLAEAVFNRYKSETELMRYIQRLQRKDYSLANGIIPLGSCTMKLNSAASMQPFMWPEFCALHPHVPADQAEGYHAVIVDFKHKLCDLTGMAACSIQPRSGAQGEYAGLRLIAAYHAAHGATRPVCLIPESAHGTNPASAALAGYTVVVVRCDSQGHVDLDDLRQKCVQHAAELGCLMLTYPSTYGLFDPNVLTITQTVHAHGGQCFFDGANLNAMMGYTAPGAVGADVCQLNLHKTFGVPHGGGGPGVGPICARPHLAPFLPSAAYGVRVGGSTPFGQVSSAGYGSASVMTIAYGMMRMLGSDGLRLCSEHAVLAANYLKKRLQEHYPVCFLGPDEPCGHEFLLDLRAFKKTAHIEAEDVAKRLTDYGLHAPTLNFPIVGTMLIEPTESEPKRELDRFADALIAIRAEIAAIERGDQPQDNNVLKNAPHTAHEVTAERWTRPYTRTQAAYPTRHQNVEKLWPSVGRIDNTYGDLNLMCTCAPLEFYQ